MTANVSDIPRCSDCGKFVVVTFAVDGTGDRLCVGCINHSLATASEKRLDERLERLFPPKPEKEDPQ